MADKAPYQMTIKLNSMRPDAISAALTTVRELCDEHDQTGDTSATITIESFKEEPLIGVRNGLELWLHRYHIGLECEVKLKAPGLRPETIAALKTKATPMDEEGWEGDEPLITPAPREPLQLMPPADWVEAEVVEEQPEGMATHETSDLIEEVEA